MSDFARIQDLVNKKKQPTNVNLATSGASQTPPAYTGGLDYAPVPPEPAPPVDLSIMDRFGMSTARRASSVAETMANATGLSADTAVMAAGGNPEDGRSDMAREAEYLTPAEASLVNPSLTDTAWQLGGDALGLVWDWGADGLVEIGQEGFSLLTAPMQESAKDEFRDFVESPIGEQGVAALTGGAEMFQKFSNAYPQEARTLAKGFDVVPGGRLMKKVFVPTALRPMRLDKVGHRDVLRPPTGRDSDVFNMIVPEQTKAQQVLQVAEGRVTDPSGLTRKQQIVPSKSEWDVVDELKKTDVGANKTMQQNANIVMDKVGELNAQTAKVASKAKGGVDQSTLQKTITSAIDSQKQSKPSIFGVDGNKSSNTVDDVLAQLDIILSRNGTTWEGILKSRQEWDKLMLRDLQIGTYGTGRKASAVQEVHTIARDVMNGLVNDNVPGTKELLKRQNLLLTGSASLNIKAADEASTALGRLMREINIHNPTTPLAQLSTLLSPIVWAGAVAVAPFVLGGKAIKTVMGRPANANKVGEIRNGIRDVISESQKALKMMTDKNLREQMQIDIKVMATLLHTLSDNKTETVENEQPPMLAAGNY